MLFRGAGLGGLLAGALLSACSSGGHHLHKEDEAPVAQRQQANPVRPVAALPILNLPSVLSLRQRQFSAKFGRALPVPTGFSDPGKNEPAGVVPIDSIALFQPHGLPMIVSFGRRTGVVQDVLLIGSDQDSLMRQAALLPDAPGYLLLPVFQPHHPTELFGLRVIPDKGKRGSDAVPGQR